MSYSISLTDDWIDSQLNTLLRPSYAYLRSRFPEHQ